jgi:hypothetical protein
MNILWKILLVLLVLLPSDALAQGVGSWISPGPLARDHADLDSVTGCVSCHSVGTGPNPRLCMECHDTVKQQVATKTGFHATRGGSCGGKCHGDHKGRDHNLIPPLDDASFDHLKETGWPLEGEHDRIRCVACHTTPNVYKGLDPECSTCHDDPHGREASKRTLLQDCESCHDAEDWNAQPVPVRVFDHTSAKQTDYVLEGLHEEVDCADCHFEWVFVPVDHEQCLSCHSNPHRADFRKEKCESCHPNAQTWDVSDFDHNRTRYRLEGLHQQVDCQECHKADKTEPLSYAKCEPCHRDLHNSQFDPRPCDECHTVQVAKFALRDYDHSQTDFPLVGKHREQECEECHEDREKAVYVDLEHEDCDQCHEDAHLGRFEPTPCSTCHISDGFLVQAFDHDKTDFPQTGKHVGLDCALCHRSGVWNGVPHDSCNDCHYPKNPHREEITADKCDECHVTEGFEVIRFDHKAETDFDLAPAHDELECDTCHKQVTEFAGLSSECTSCHEDDRPWGHYQGDCADCHEAEHWFPAGLGNNEHDITGFALVGAHALEPCESCHPVGLPRGEAEPECGACHMRDDPHMNMLGMMCADCHNEMSWLHTTWRHTTTGWPLRGAHRLAACVDCHAAGYIGTPTECYACHEAEADPLIPEHTRAAARSCDSCHRVYAWIPAQQYPH